MKKIALLVAVAALSACAQPAEETPVPADTVAAADAAAATPVAWTGFEPGSYTVTDDEGVKIDFVLTADSYTATMPDGSTANGTLVIKDGKGCMTNAEGEESCWKNAAPGPDGSWVATSDDGDTSTVMKKAA